MICFRLTPLWKIKETEQCLNDLAANGQVLRAVYGPFYHFSPYKDSKEQKSMNRVYPITGCSFGTQPTMAYPSRVISITIRLTNTETQKQGRAVWKKNGTSVGIYTQKALRKTILQCHFYAWWSFLLYAMTKG